MEGINLTLPIRAALVAASCALLAWGWASRGYILLAASVALLGLIWILLGPRWAVVSYVSFWLAAVFAGAGEILHLPPIPLLLSLSFALAAWDLDHFSRRIALAAKEDPILVLERRHLTRLGLILVAGLALSLAAIAIRGPRFNFEISAGLALLAAWGLTYLVLRLRRARDT